MEIEEIKINSYGKLKNKNLNCKKINIIFGKNEAGKSTLLNFVINLFYNISKNKNGKNISDFDKYFPWDENDFSGKIIYKLNNKNKYEVYRNFNKKNPEIFDENGEEISDQFNVDKKSGNLFFLDQIKVDRDTLMSTVVAAQNETQIDESRQNILIQKVANLAESGDEDVSYKKAINKLDKMLLSEVGTNKSQDRPINIARENILNYENQIDEIKNIENKKFEIENKNKEIKNEIEKNEANKNIYNEVEKILNNSKVEEEKINIKKNILSENTRKLENYKTEKENKKVKNNKQIIYFAVFLLLLIIGNILSFIFIKNKIVNYTLLCLIPIFLIYYFIKNKTSNSKDIKIKIETMQNNNLELKKEIEKLEKDLKTKNEIEKDKLIKIYGKDIEELFNYRLIEELISDNKRDIENLKLELHKLELDRDNIEPKIEKLAELEEALYIEKENLKNLEEKTEIFNMTRELIENSYQEMKNNITPKFNNNLSKNIEKLSNGKYKKIVLNNGISVELENGRYIPVDRLSAGTIEQIYLALRLSIIDEISPETLPILLDETFAYYDDERLEAALKFLCNIDNQILLFTCTEREKNILDKLNIEYNLIEL